MTLTAPAPAKTDAAPTTGRWEGVLGVEGEMTGDRRFIDPGALRWTATPDEPLPLRYVKSDIGAHDGAVVVGKIDGITRREDGTLWGVGSFDLGSPEGVEAHRQVQEGLTTGVSMDLDDVSFEVRGGQVLELGEPGEPDLIDAEEVMATTNARIRAATLLAVPAFATARIRTTTEEFALTVEASTDEGQLADLRDALGELLEGEASQFGPELAPNITSAVQAIPLNGFEGSGSSSTALLMSLVALRTAFHRDRPAIAAEWGDGGAERVRDEIQTAIRATVDYLNTPGLPWAARTATLATNPAQARIPRGDWVDTPTTVLARARSVM